jgi:hypothetical protein
VQVKTSTDLDVRDGVIHHRLHLAHFNNLAGAGFQVPRFLAVVAVPTDVAGYAVCTDEHMVLSTAAYWLSLADQEIRPLRNLLTVAALQSLLDGDLERAAR